MLGPAGTVEGFDTFWQAAATVAPHLCGPADYVHHRFGDVEALREVISRCRWDISELRPITSVRSCTDVELWRWLWGSLPLRTRDGAFVPQTERNQLEASIRHEFFEQAQQLKVGERYVIRSLAHMAIASAVAAHRNSPPSTKASHEPE